MRRSRLPLLLLPLGLGLTASAVAQTPRVGLVVSLSQPEPNGGRRPLVQVQDLLNDPAWRTALDQAFPIRLSFHLEIWRSREGWVDQFQRSTDWSAVVQWEPLEDQYKVTTIVRSGPEERRFTSRQELEAWARSTFLVDVLPEGTGTFYYSVRLGTSALSDEDMEELERFLAGMPDSQIRPQQSSISRTLRRFLLRLAGLPREELEAQSGRFAVVRRR